jgi:hypothetical protein
MKDFFAMLYSWFGIFPIYSRDMHEFLRGMDAACSGYYALPGYFYIGIAMILSTCLLFALREDLISPDRFTQWEHFGIGTTVTFLTNFFIAFLYPFIRVLRHDYCPHLTLSAFDCFLFAISNGIWACILFSILRAIVGLLSKPGKA